ncbi:P-loop containing nucleoside triphosphate hydrolase protein [Amylocystis lapponica]|nr:P-loop containing nucleoside triphosphate hydrolase protein [Amylocystis lapponica]
MYRGIFKFGVFNAVQSKCYDTVTPTGSGKTVLFELAMIKMLTEPGANSRTSKCIYVAPTKALCSEKCRDWTAKFQPLGINCCELTGDTVHFGKSAWGNARDATVILTRNWYTSTSFCLFLPLHKFDDGSRGDHGHILSQIRLFLVDEVHILNESRGSTLEVIMSRMKTRGSSVRFVVVSATVPNIEDVAHWIGNGVTCGSATVMQFGDEFRPCKLSKFVYGIPKKKDQNDFVYQRTLDYRIYGIVQQHSLNKPMLVFCATRKGVMATAEQLYKEYGDATEKKQTLPWSQLAASGIGVHHAGLSMDDRRAIEDLYLKKILRVVVATSTLAVGVNLPAHTVIIKGVKMFQNNAMQEYSDMDIVQMMGRAGRPQFDKEGVAIIMCETELEEKYKNLVQGRTQLESSLHLNLSEHINSEIGLGTITNLESAKDWLRNSFLFQRIQKNPKHYAIGKENDQTWQDRIDVMVTQSVSKLQETQLVTNTEETDGSFASTDFGDIMSKFYIRQTTVRHLCLSVYNKMRTHADIRFQVKKIEKPADKVFLLIQAVLGGLSLSDPEFRAGDSSPVLESLPIFRHVTRIARALVEAAIVKEAGAQIKHGLEARLLNRRPPFGNEILAFVRQLPQYTLKITEVNVTKGGGQQPVAIELSVECGLLVEDSVGAQSKKGKNKRSDMTVVLTLTSDLDYIDFRRIPTKNLRQSKSFEITAELKKPSQSIVVYMTSESIAGVMVSATYKPNVDAKCFPILDTRPQTAMDVMLEGLDDDPDFWNMNPDSDRSSKPTSKPTVASSVSFLGPKQLSNGNYEYASFLSEEENHVNLVTQVQSCL